MAIRLPWSRFANRKAPNMPFPTQKDVEIPLLRVLEKLGGEGKPQEIYPRVAKYFPQLTEDDLKERLSSSPHTFKWRNLIQWARQSLVDSGEIDGSTHGVWKITPKGLQRINESEEFINVDTEGGISQENQEFYTDDSNQIPPPDIVTFNELRSCADLVRMYKQQTLEIQPEFQRHVVWKGPSQTRFIDSLVKGLPVPSMCFSHDYSTGKWQVIDGLQRITSIIRFLSEDDWRLSNLDDIDPNIAGRSTRDFRDPKSPLNKFYCRVQDITIPVNVIRCDYRKASHSNFLFTIFHRLNTGGMRLTNQEIRNCIFSGDLNRLLIDLSDNSPWARLVATKANADRFQGEELILRFFAFYDNLSNYTGRLAAFLNDYMREHRNPGDQWIQEKRSLFERTVKLLDASIPSRYRETTTVLEALTYGISRHLDKLEKADKALLQSRVQQIKSIPEFIELSSGYALAGREKVTRRLQIAEQEFGL